MKFLYTAFGHGLPFHPDAVASARFPIIVHKKNLGSNLHKGEPVAKEVPILAKFLSGNRVADEILGVFGAQVPAKPQKPIKSRKKNCSRKERMQGFTSN